MVLRRTALRARLFARARGHPARRRRQPGARVQGGGRDTAVHRPRGRLAAAGRRRQPVHRLRDVVGAAHPRARAARPGARAVAAAAKRGTSFGAPSPLEAQLGERVRALMPSIETRPLRQFRHRSRDERSARGAGGHRTRRHHQVRRLLPRPRRRVSGEGRIRRAHRWGRRPALA